MAENRQEKIRQLIEDEKNRHPHDVFYFNNLLMGYEEMDLYPLINRACPPQFKTPIRVATSRFGKSKMLKVIK